jgi:hypothetical protein
VTDPATFTSLVEAAKQGLEPAKPKRAPRVAAKT